MAPTVVFDIGNVLLDFDYGIVAPKIAARATASAGEVKRALNQSPLLHRFETGLMSREQFFEEVSAATGFRGDLNEFSGLFGDIFSPILPMIELHAKLRKSGVTTCIFSNTNDLAICHIRHRYPFFADFDHYIFSYEHGAMKPDAKLYEVVERMAGRRGSELLYLDDRAENVAAGAARGWQVILHETPEKTCEAMRNLRLVV